MIMYAQLIGHSQKNVWYYPTMMRKMWQIAECHLMNILKKYWL